MSKGSGKGKGKGRPGKGYGKKRKGPMRSYDINKGYTSNDDGATFHGRQPLKDPSGKAYPTDKADQCITCPDCLNHDSVQGDTLGHARGSLGCPAVHKGTKQAHYKF